MHLKWLLKTSFTITQRADLAKSLRWIPFVLFLGFSTPVLAQTKILLAGKVVSANSLQVTYASTVKPGRVVGVFKSGRETITRELPLMRRNKRTTSIPLQGLYAKKVYTFEVRFYNSNKLTARSKTISFVLRRPVAPTSADINLVGTNNDPIVVTLSSDPKLVCTIGDSGVQLTKLSECKYSLQPKDLSAISQSLVYSLKDSKTGAKSKDARVNVVWQQTGSFGGNYQSFGHYRDVLTEDEARFLAKTTSFGRNSDEIVRIATDKAKGLDAAVDYILTPKTSVACGRVKQEALAIAKPFMVPACIFDYVPASTGTVPVKFCTSDTEQGRVAWGVEALQRYWFYMLRYGCDPIRERMALLFHNHFAINLAYAANYADPEMFEHVEALRGEGSSGIAANFEKLVARMHGDDVPMIVWLNNGLNTYDRITNQNYARELMELFTLGQLDPVRKTSNYSERSVQEMTQVLTGYQTIRVPHPAANGISMCCTAGATGCLAATQCRPAETVRTIFNYSRWSPPRVAPQPRPLFSGFPWGKSDIFKANSLIEGEDTVTSYLLYSHPGTARFLATRLIATFATVEPTDEMVSEVSQIILQDKYNLSRALKKIFTSQSFFATEARKDCVASPIENLISVLSALDLPVLKNGDHDLMSVVNYYSTRQGHSLTMPDTVFGWQECGKLTGGKIHKGTTWLVGYKMLERDRVMAQYLSRLDAIKKAIGFSWANLIYNVPGRGRSPEFVVDALANKMAISLTPKEKALLVEYYSTVSLRSLTLPTGMVVPAPNYNRTVNIASLSDVELDQYLTLKVPGLIQILWTMVPAQLR